MLQKGELYKIVEGGLSNTKSKPLPIGGQPFYSEGFVIEFFKKDKSSWIGNFRRGFSGFDAVYEYPKSDKVIVFAGGTIYVINPESDKPLKELGDNYKEVIWEENGKLITYDFTDIAVIESDGSVWTSDRISWDGLKDIKVFNDVVSGSSYDPMDNVEKWVPFSLNLITKKLEGGSHNKYYNSKENKIKKPWWKIF